jgi:hypothetical protein
MCVWFLISAASNKINSISDLKLYLLSLAEDYHRRFADVMTKDYHRGYQSLQIYSEHMKWLCEKIGQESAKHS